MNIMIMMPRPHPMYKMTDWKQCVKLAAMILENLRVLYDVIDMIDWYYKIWLIVIITCTRTCFNYKYEW